MSYENETILQLQDDLYHAQDAYDSLKQTEADLRYDLDIAREANQDWMQENRDLRSDLDEAQSALRFANDTNEQLLALNKRLREELAFAKQDADICGTMANNAMDTVDDLEKQLTVERSLSKGYRKLLALETLKRVEVQYDDGVLTQTDLDAAKQACLDAGCDDIDIAARWTWND